VWKEKSIRTYIIIRSKYGFNNIKKISDMIKAYEIIKKLKAGRKISSSRLIELIIKFYTLHFVDYKSMTDFFSQL